MGRMDSLGVLFLFCSIFFGGAAIFWAARGNSFSALVSLIFLVYSSGCMLWFLISDRETEVEEVNDAWWNKMSGLGRLIFWGAVYAVMFSASVAGFLMGSVLIGILILFVLIFFLAIDMNTLLSMVEVERVDLIELSQEQWDALEKFWAERYESENENLMRGEGADETIKEMKNR